MVQRVNVVAPERHRLRLHINCPIDLLLAKAVFRIGTLDRHVLGWPRILMEMCRGLATPDRQDPIGASNDIK
jgi:hypothetical protein